MLRPLLTLLLFLGLSSAARADEEPAPAEDGPATAEDGPAPAEEGPAPVEAEPTPAESPAAAEPAEPAPAPESAAAAEPAAATPAAPADRLASVVRILSSGRVGAGLIVDNGAQVVTLLETVQVGWPALIERADGTVTRGRIVAVDPIAGLARLQLDDAGPSVPSPARIAAPTPGQELIAVGHGGSVALGPSRIELRAQLVWSERVLRAVAAAPATSVDPEYPWRILVVDGSVGEGDAGSPLWTRDGAFVGLLAEPLEDSGGRALAVGAEAVMELLAAPDRELPWARRTHFQWWSGVGTAAGSNPIQLGGSVLTGFRVAILDVLRLEPFVELDLGFRGPLSEPVARPLEFWWAVGTGLNVGARIPLRRLEGRRDYVVPTVGLRVDWNRFEHRQDTLVADCPLVGGGCNWGRTRDLDRLSQTLVGVDLGIDLRRGPMRFGYRFFIDPAAVRDNATHRFFVTFDDFPLPLRAGDSH